MAATTRRAARHPVRLRVYFQRHGAVGFLDATTENLSQHGAFVRTQRRPPAVGTRLRLVLREAAAGDDVSVPATVSWTRHSRAAGSAPQGMGVRFEHLDEVARHAIATLIAHHGTG